MKILMGKLVSLFAIQYGLRTAH